MQTPLDGHIDERSLTEGVRKGDMVAFETVFRRYYPHLVLFACKYLKDKDKSESLVQDVFVQIWEKREDLELKSLRSFLLVSVRNRCHNELKHLKVVRDFEKKATNDNEQEWPEYRDRFYLDKINAAIDRMPAQRKRVFRMSRVEGLKYSEIADKLNISVKTVEVHMGKALKHLREELLPLKQQILNLFL